MQINLNKFKIKRVRVQCVVAFVLRILNKLCIERLMKIVEIKSKIKNMFMIE
jgi:hypothetical protein